MDGWMDVLRVLRCATPSAQGPFYCLAFGLELWHLWYLLFVSPLPPGTHALHSAWACPSPFIHHPCRDARSSLCRVFTIPTLYPFPCLARSGATFLAAAGIGGLSWVLLCHLETYTVVGLRVSALGHSG